MTDEIGNLLLEHMKRFQATLARIERELEELTGRMGRSELAIAGLRRDLAHMDDNIAAVNVRLDRVDQRLDRIEKRLELVD